MRSPFFAPHIGVRQNSRTGNKLLLGDVDGINLHNVGEIFSYNLNFTNTSEQILAD
jgi:hypothetical protein